VAVEKTCGGDESDRVAGDVHVERLGQVAHTVDADEESSTLNSDRGATYDETTSSTVGKVPEFMSQTPSVWDLELPLFDTENLDRLEALEVAQRLAEDHWIVRTELGVAVLRQPDVAGLLRDRRFHNALSQIPRMNGVEDPEGFLDNRRRSILATEGDEHTRLRRLVSPAFTPTAADRHRPAMRSVISELVDPFLDRGRVELVEEICEPYPIPIICEVLGAPKEDWRQFSAWATDIFKIFNGNLAEDLPAIQGASESIAGYVEAMVEERRLAPTEDLLSDLIAVEEEGDRLSTPELCMLAEAVLMAGTDTTRNQLACTMAVLAQRPAVWAELRANPEKIDRVVEETMRFLGAVRATVRIASEDIEFKGVIFPKGTIVTAHLGAANRDPSVFADPSEINLDVQRPTEQMTFGSGIHRCLGAALARAELQEALRVLLERFETVTLDGPITWKPATFGIWGPATLPLSFSTSAARP